MTLGRTYFTCAYLSIRMLRDYHHSTLPIEVFYAADNEISPAFIAAIEASFSNVKFTDIYKTRDFPVGVSMNGFQIKAFSLLMSSFEEALWLDADNMPATDPAIVFNLPQYKQTGAMFWPDLCHVHTARKETWYIFGLPTPEFWPSANKPVVVTDSCDPREPREVMAGEIIVHKRKAWRGLVMSAFINRHYEFFGTTFIVGDKQTFAFSFNVTNTPYALAEVPPITLGRAATTTRGDLFYCANTVVQHNPLNGEFLFLHRNLAKFSSPSQYFESNPFPLAWTHVGRQNPYSAYKSIHREEAPTLDVFLPLPAASQIECFVPLGPELKVERAPRKVRLCDQSDMIDALFMQ